MSVYIHKLFPISWVWWHEQTILLLNIPICVKFQKLSCTLNLEYPLNFATTINSFTGNDTHNVDVADHEDLRKLPLIWFQLTQGLYSLSGKTSHRKISWSLEAASFGFKLFQSPWNLAGTSAALLPRCLSNFRAIRPLQHPISRLRDFTRFGGRTSYRLVKRGPGPSSRTQCTVKNYVHLRGTVRKSCIQG